MQCSHLTATAQEGPRLVLPTGPSNSRSAQRQTYAAIGALLMARGPSADPGGIRQFFSGQTEFEWRMVFRAIDGMVVGVQTNLSGRFLDMLETRKGHRRQTPFGSLSLTTSEPAGLRPGLLGDHQVQCLRNDWTSLCETNGRTQAQH